MIQQAPILTADECADILQAWPPHRLAPATVRTPRGQRVAADYRRCLVATIGKPRQLLERVRQALADRVGLPVANQEPAILARYAPGGRFQLHHDQPQNPDLQRQFEATGGPRLFSGLVALTDASHYVGGALVFPDLQAWFRPDVGTLTWWPNDTQAARHEAETVHEGIKVVLLLFVRQREYTAPGPTEWPTEWPR